MDDIVTQDNQEPWEDQGQTEGGGGVRSRGPPARKRVNGGGDTTVPALTSQGGHWAQQRGRHLWTRPSHEWAKRWSPLLSYSNGA